MVCYNDYPLGPCAVCLKIGGYSNISDDGKWNIGFLCEDHHQIKGEANVKKAREAFRAGAVEKA